MKQILCIIPARSGSKGLPNKNIKILKDKPLIAWSIDQAKQSKYYKNMRIIVSTDSIEYMIVAKKYGAEVPVLRPSDISSDSSLDIEFITHMVVWLSENENYNPDLILQLRPTTPLRSVEIIDDCIDKFINNYDNYDSLRTVSLFEKSPFKMYTIENNNLNPLFKNINNIKEPYNCGRQMLPTCYIHNGYVDIIKTNILKNNTISGDNIYPYIIYENIIDIDTIDDWNKLEKKINTKDV